MGVKSTNSKDCLQMGVCFFWRVAYKRGVKATPPSSDTPRLPTLRLSAKFPSWPSFSYLVCTFGSYLAPPPLEQQRRAHMLYKQTFHFPQVLLTNFCLYFWSQYFLSGCVPIFLDLIHFSSSLPLKILVSLRENPWRWYIFPSPAFEERVFFGRFETFSKTAKLSKKPARGIFGGNWRPGPVITLPAFVRSALIRIFVCTCIGGHFFVLDDWGSYRTCVVFYTILVAKIPQFICIFSKAVKNLAP